MVFRLRHPGRRVPDPQVWSAVERVGAVRAKRRFQHQDFLGPGHRNADLVDPDGRFQLADRIGHVLKRGVRGVLTLNLARIGDAEEDFAARPIQEAAERHHPALQLTGGLLELDVFPFAFAVGDEGLEFDQRHGSGCGHAAPSYSPMRIRALSKYMSSAGSS